MERRERASEEEKQTETSMESNGRTLKAVSGHKEHHNGATSHCAAAPHELGGVSMCVQSRY